MAKQTAPLNSESLEQHEGVIHLMELFKTDLSNVQFPGVSGESLEAELKTLTQARVDLETAEQAVEEASIVVRDNATRLQKHMTLALSYARIYAENEQSADGEHHDLANKLGDIALPGIAKMKTVRKTKIKREAKAEENTNIMPNAEAPNAQAETETKSKSKSKYKGSKKSTNKELLGADAITVPEQEMRAINSEMAPL